MVAYYYTAGRFRQIISTHNIKLDIKIAQDTFAEFGIAQRKLLSNKAFISPAHISFSSLRTKKRGISLPQRPRREVSTDDKSMRMG